MRMTWYGFLPQFWWCRSHFTYSRDHRINYTWAQALFASYSKFVHQTPTRTLNILYVFVVSVKDMMTVKQTTYQNVCGSIICEVTFGWPRDLLFAPQAGGLNMPVGHVMMNNQLHTPLLNMPTTAGYAIHCWLQRDMQFIVDHDVHRGAWDL